MWIPNKDQIKDWNDNYRHYKNLLEWKTTVFDPKVEYEMKVYMEEQKKIKKAAPVKQHTATSMNSNKWKKLMKNITTKVESPSDAEKVKQLRSKSDVSGTLKRHSIASQK